MTTLAAMLAVSTVMWVEPVGGARASTGAVVPAATAPVALAVAGRAAPVVSDSQLVSVQQGMLPIIIVAGHGGMVRIPGSKDRTEGVTVRDVNTAQIALLVAQRLTERLGGTPSVVVVNFSRKDADVNRPPAQAYQSPAAKPHYDAYHKAIGELIAAAQVANPNVLLIDIHGQKREPDAIVRGTRNLKTVAALVARSGVAAINGPDSIFGRLAKAGYRVIPAIDAEGVAGEPNAEPELSAGRELFFDGGFTVANYGHALVKASDPQPTTAKAIDAIQIEIGGQRSNALDKCSRDIADAIAHFAVAYGYAPNPADQLPEPPEQFTPRPSTPANATKPNMPNPDPSAQPPSPPQSTPRDKNTLNPGEPK